MDKEKLAEKLSLLIQDKDFVLKLAETKSDEEAVKLFAENGCGELKPEKVKIVRDTLNSLLKGEMKISEDDLENISGGAVDYTKVLAVALATTVVIGGMGAIGNYALKHSNSTPPVPQAPTAGERAMNMAGKAGEAIAPVVADALRAAAGTVAGNAGRSTWGNWAYVGTFGLIGSPRSPAQNAASAIQRRTT